MEGINGLRHSPSSAPKSPPVNTSYAAIADKLDTLARSEGGVREMAFSWSKLWQNFRQRRGSRRRRTLATAA